MMAAQPSRTRVWLHAFRLHTLPLAAAAILTGLSVAAVDYPIRPAVAVLCFTTAILLQILSNLANDYGDAVHGADNALRTGPVRATASGLLAPQDIRRGIGILAALSLASGIGLLLAALPVIGNTGVLVLFLVGLLAIAAAITYTAGKLPYGYRGLGDLSVFLFFGVVGVVGTAYINTGKFAPEMLLPAAGFGLLSAGVLNINNLRDLNADRAAGKKTIALRLGLKKGKTYHYSLLLAALVLYAAYAATKLSSPYYAVAAMLPGLVFVGKNIGGLSQANKPEEINPWLKQLVKGIVLHSVAYCFFLWWVRA